MSIELAERVWLITGCSSGLGRALAERVLAHGHRLVATARHPEQCVDLAEKYPDTCRTVALDVTDPAQVQRALAAAIDAFQRIDVLVNNAGCGLLGALEECDEDQMRRNFDTNFFGALRVIRAALPTLRAQGRGHIINISAIAAVSNYAGFAIYGASKAALEAASEALALELHPFGVCVTLVQPGPFRTGFSGSLERAAPAMSEYAGTSGKFAELLKKLSGAQPGDPAKAAEAIIQITEAERPPLRLALGKYATDKALEKLESRRLEIEAWKAVGGPTDF